MPSTTRWTSASSRSSASSGSDLIRSIDGPLAPIRCASLTAYRACADCPDPEACAIRVLMTDVRNAISDVLDRRTLRDQIELEALRGEVAA